MEIKRILGLAFTLTFILFLIILSTNLYLDNLREQSINERMSTINNDVYDLQKIMLMSDVYGERMACLAFQEKINDYNSRLWDLGQKLEQYRVASEEVKKNEYYYEQKTRFNEQQIIYSMLLQELSDTCNISMPQIMFFYRNAKECEQCDAQSYILTDLKQTYGSNISVFAFDSDLNLTTVKLLENFYNISSYPCVIIDGNVSCKFMERQEIVNAIEMREPSPPQVIIQ